MGLTGQWYVPNAVPPTVAARPIRNHLFDRETDFLHDLARRMGSAVPLPQVLASVVDFVSSIVRCDSCFVYVLEKDFLVLRASKNPRPGAVNRVKLRVGQGITGWVAQHREPVALSKNAFQDPRFQIFRELPEDRFEAILSVPILSRGRVVGVINLQNRAAHMYGERAIRLVSTIGCMVGAEIERARLAEENAELSQQLEARKTVERAKGILQKDLGIGEREAYLMLQRQSQQRRKSMKDIAEAVILSHAITHA